MPNDQRQTTIAEAMKMTPRDWMAPLEAEIERLRQLACEFRDEADRLRGGLEWIMENVDHSQAPLLIGHVRYLLRGDRAKSP